MFTYAVKQPVHWVALLHLTHRLLLTMADEARPSHRISCQEAIPRAYLGESPIHNLVNLVR